MRHRMLFFALCTSLAFNIGFLVMFAYFTHNRPKSLMPRSSRGNQSVNRVFQSEELKEMRKNNIDLRIGFYENLAQADVNYNQVEMLITQIEDIQKTMELYILKHFVQLRQESTPEEAKEIFDRYVKRYKERRERIDRQNNSDGRKGDGK